MIFVSKRNNTGLECILFSEKIVLGLMCSLLWKSKYRNKKKDRNLLLLHSFHFIYHTEYAFLIGKKKCLTREILLHELKKKNVKWEKHDKNSFFIAHFPYLYV